MSIVQKGPLGAVGLGCVATVAALSSCATSSTPSAPSQDVASVYSIAAVVPAAAMTSCPSSLQGQVEFVVSPPGLFACLAGHWQSISCNSDDVGSVAYSS